ncbi:uncharacterized protein LOC110459550 [Mizuhopecten yessoensis]|uniref:uncharacterized protein LOC110459550 n=1 Tax=Mizuhopecten yessoensis TaxID=6573 RepID=UPI000B459C8B|nr:uncharacterized protein LOC110459550 [Mizuhopecten yessoensis]
MASSGYPSSFTSITTEQVRDLRIKKLGGGNGDITGNSEHAAVQPSGKQETGEDQLHTPMDTSTNRSTGYIEVDGEPPMTNVAGACARTHQMAITGTTLGRDPETYLCDSVGWQFYLDYLASKLSAEISEISVYLDLESGKLDEIKNRCKSNRHEMCFNVLWTWYGRNPDKKKRLKQMNTALKESGRADLAQQLMEGNVPVPENYRYQGEIKNPDAGVSGSDALKVGKHLTLTFQSLARYFGLDENNIQSICIDNNDDIQEQSYNTIKLCINQLKLKNRRQLCNGLAYLEQFTTVSELNQMW